VRVHRVEFRPVIVSDASLTSLSLSLSLSLSPLFDLICPCPESSQLLQTIQEVFNRKAKEVHLVFVRRWNAAGVDESIGATEACQPKKMRVSSYEELQRKVAEAFGYDSMGGALQSTKITSVAGEAAACSTVSASSAVDPSTVLTPGFSSLRLSAAAATAAAAPPLFTLYYILDPSKWWTTRIKIDDEDEFKNYVQSQRNYHLRPVILVWNSPSNCAIVEHADLAIGDHQHSPLKDGTPPQQLDALLPMAYFSSASVISPSKSGSSRSSAQQADFSDAVRHRDDDCCVVCKAVQVEAAHVVPVKEARTVTGKEQAQLLSLYDPRNGLTLCTHCHDYFDAGLWCLSADDRCTMMVSDALVAYVPSWKERRGAPVRMPSHHADNWPSKGVLEVQLDFFHSCKLKRIKVRRDFPFFCSACGVRFMTKDGANQHRKYCDGRGKVKPSQFHTPDAKRKADNARSRNQQQQAHQQQLESQGEEQEDTETSAAAVSSSALHMLSPTVSSPASIALPNTTVGSSSVPPQQRRHMRPRK
jgi:hypothetical protein